MFVVEDFGKVTISLGGVCNVACPFCYITVKDFKHAPQRTVNEVVGELEQLNGVKCICVSCDIDPLLRQEDNLSLMRILAERHPSAIITFTSRLLPSAKIYDEMRRLADECTQRRQLFVPAVSLATFSHPNTLENSKRVPSSEQRLGLIQRYVDDGIPCLIALRPTFPFELVPREESINLVKALPQGVASVLGEAFLVDASHKIPRKLGWTSIDGLMPASGKMTFNDQSSMWDKYLLPAEVEFARTICNDRGLPYFLRSMSGFNYLTERWDHNTRSIRHDPDVKQLRDKISLLP